MTLSHSSQFLWWLILLKIVLTVESINAINLNWKSDSETLTRNKREDKPPLSNLQLNVTFRDLQSEKGFLIGSSPSVVMDVMLVNSGDVVEEPAILVSWWRLQLKQTTPEDNCSLFEEGHNMVTYKCLTGQPLQAGESSSVSFEFDMSRLSISEQTVYELMFNVTAVAGSLMYRPISESIMLPLYAQADLHIHGSSPNQDIFEKEMPPSSQVSFAHNFKIGLDGPSPVSNVIAVFELPVNLTAEPSGIGAPTVNIRGFHKEGDDDDKLVCHVTRGHFSKSKSDHPSNEHVSMNEVDAEDPDFEVTGMGGQDEDNPMDKYLAKMTSTNLMKNDRLVMSCNSPSVSCLEVTCRIDEFRPSTVISISFLMELESDLVQGLMEFYNVSIIQIESEGRVTIPYIVDDMDVQSLTNKPNEVKATTNIYGKEKFNKSKLSYILAGGIGIVVVLVLIALSIYAFHHLKKLRRDSVLDAAEMNPLKMNDIPVNTQTDFRI